MNFVSLVVNLHPKDKYKPLDYSAGVYAHAAVFKALSSYDPVTGQYLHDMAHYKKISIALLTGSKRTPKLRLTLIDDNGISYTNTVINALAQQQTLQLGRQNFTIGNIKLDNTSWAAVATWTDLWDDAPRKFIRFLFMTPTAFTKRARNEKFYSLFPTPVNVFTGLTRKWRVLNGPTLPDGLLDWITGGGCVVAEHRLETKNFRVNQWTQIGFIGTITYEILGENDVYTRALNGLAKLAFFTGIGCQTARGMGLTQVRLSD